MITLNVEPHSCLGADYFLTGTVKIKGDLRVDHDLQGGQRFTVKVIDGDGEVICEQTLVAQTPTLKDIIEKQMHIGVERIHTLAVTAE